MQNAASAVGIGLGGFTVQQYSKGHKAPKIFIKRVNQTGNQPDTTDVGMNVNWGERWGLWTGLCEYVLPFKTCENRLALSPYASIQCSYSNPWNHTE